MDEEDTTFLWKSHKVLQIIRLQNNNIYLFSPANSVTQSNHYVNGGECNGLVQLNEIPSQTSSQNYWSVREQYTTPQEINENEKDEILNEKVRNLNVIWDPICCGYKDQTRTCLE